MPAEDLLDQIADLFARTPQVKFAYLFGSHARGDAGPLSDLDLAVFLDARLSPFRYRLHLIESVAHALGTERFDLVTLNDAPAALKFEVIRDGKVIKENRRRRVAFEAKAIGEYLDTAHLRRTQESYLKAQLTRGDSVGQ